MLEKPTKYRMKVCMAIDSNNRYVLNFDDYLGKELGSGEFMGCVMMRSPR